MNNKILTTRVIVKDYYTRKLKMMILIKALLLKVFSCHFTPLWLLSTRFVI